WPSSTICWCIVGSLMANRLLAASAFQLSPVLLQASGIPYGGTEELVSTSTWRSQFPYLSFLDRTSELDVRTYYARAGSEAIEVGLSEGCREVNITMSFRRIQEAVHRSMRELDSVLVAEGTPTDVACDPISEAECFQHTTAMNDNEIDSALAFRVLAFL